MLANKKRRFVYSFLLPVAMLLSMTVVPISAKIFGNEILVETVPYDPRDIFRGDYVALSYKINEVPIEKFPDEIKNETDVEKIRNYRNKSVYAILKKDGDFHVVDRVSFERPQSGIYLKSSLRNVYGFEYRMRYDENSDKPYYESPIYLKYNIDRYFVPENTGRDLEKMSIEGNLVAKVKVYRGYALLEEVFPEESISGD